jgi:hypothetical protein
MTATVQWQAHAGITHAWLAQCEGYVSLCGREVSGFGGQRSGIRCGLCATSAGWAEQTGESSYWTPQGPMIVEARVTPMVHVEASPQPIPRRRRPRPMVLGSTPVPVVAHEGPPPVAIPTPVPVAPVESPVGLITPDSMAAYQALPVSEQRYWAPMMLARAGQDAVWDQSQETAEQFQERCYAALQTREDGP